MTLVICVILATLAFTYTNGFHDTANSIATVVSTKVLSPRQAILLSASTNLVGAMAGTAVLYIAWFADRFNGGKQTVATVFALAYYALFAAGESEAALAVSQILANVAILAIWAPPATTPRSSGLSRLRPRAPARSGPWDRLAGCRTSRLPGTSDPR